MDNLLTVSEVAQIFEVTEYTVRVWLKADKLQGIKPAHLGGQWRIPQSAVVDFANQQYGENSATK